MSAYRTWAFRTFAVCAVVGLTAMYACGPAVRDSTGGANDRDSAWRTAFDTRDAGVLSSVWGSTPTDVFMVGGVPAQGEVYHYDGALWKRMDIPLVPILIWVFGFGTDDVYATGDKGTAMHYDGRTWTVLETGTRVGLWGVWGVSAGDHV